VKATIVADTGLRPSFALEAFDDLDADVRQSIRRIEASPFIPRTDTAGSSTRSRRGTSARSPP